MKKKLLTLLLATTLSISLFACGGSDSSTKEEPETTDETEDTSDQEELEEPETEGSEDSETESDLDALSEIEVEEELFDVVLTIPAEYVGETTQEELDATAAETGMEIVLNDDGSATYTMTKSQHKEMLDGIAASLDESLNEMIGSEDYPSITAITANDDYTSFTVTTTSTELDLNESLSVMMFYTCGGMYSVFSGETVDNIHVDFVNADSGEIISSADSSDLESAE